MSNIYVDVNIDNVSKITIQFDVLPFLTLCSNKEGACGENDMYILVPICLIFIQFMKSFIIFRDLVLLSIIYITNLEIF